MRIFTRMQHHLYGPALVGYALYSTSIYILHHHLRDQGTRVVWELASQSKWSLDRCQTNFNMLISFCLVIEFRYLKAKISELFSYLLLYTYKY